MEVKDYRQGSLFNLDAEKNSYRKICNSISNSDFLTPDEFGNSLRRWADQNLNTQINIVALFSGAGGLDIGFCDAGFRLLESVEIEEKFVKTMLHNQQEGKYFVGANILCLDINLYEPKVSSPIDFVIGGPPCQSFSAAGRRAAGVAGTKDDRGSLFEQYVRVIEKLKPKGFLFENVYGLLGAEKGESIKKIVSAFEKIGYIISYRVLDAADYGVPQHRERLIIVGSKERRIKFPKPTHGPDACEGYPHLSAKMALVDAPIIEGENTPSINGRFGHLLSEVPPGLNYSFFTEKMGHPKPIFAWRSKFSDFLYKADPNTPVRTIKASGGQYTGPFHWNNRHFSIAELKRLQTFPDDYKILGNRAIISKQIGNSVPPQFARMLALSILDQIFSIKLPFEIKYLEEHEKLSFRTLKSAKTSMYFTKAVNALDETKNEKAIKIHRKKYKVELSPNFRVIQHVRSKVTVKFLPNSDVWTLKLTRNEDENEVYIIEITRKGNKPLFGSIKSVTLISCSKEHLDYTLLWKTFELILIENNIKADLVQFNGYYQYVNDISYGFIKKSAGLDDNIWRTIELILSDPAIGQINNIKQIAKDYDINEEELIRCFYELKKLGFEIRNTNTNPEIDPNHYLIPYRFPTLSPLSVQLNKSLT